MSRPCVIDTNVLQKTNAPITKSPRENRDFKKRLDLLKSINSGTTTVLISTQLLAEYKNQLKEPRNDFLKAFFTLLTSGRAISNWEKEWSSKREAARKCRYPQHDDHVLRTAIHKDMATTILTEENPMLNSAGCIRKKFDVIIKSPLK